MNAILKFPQDPIYNVVPRDYEGVRMTIEEELEDDLMCGEAIGKDRGGKIDLVFLIDGEDMIPDHDAAALLIADRDKRLEMLDALEDRARKIIRHFLEYHKLGEDIVANRHIDRLTNSGMDRDDEL